MSIENALRRRVALLERLGKTGLNIKYPNDFELYVIALELLDSQQNTLRYFLFPVMPESLDETLPSLQSIKKTLSGIHILTTPTFVSTDINLSGSFGRRLRVLLGGEYTDFLTSIRSRASSVFDRSKGKEEIDSFDAQIKTGYGCIKILESIIKESSEVDEQGMLKTLVLHNPALGNSYIVRPTSLRLSQNKQTNMIWNYSLTLKSIAPLSAFFTAKELEDKRKQLGGTSLVQSQLDTTTTLLTRYIAKQNSNFIERKQKPAVNKFKNYLREKL